MSSAGSTPLILDSRSTPRFRPAGGRSRRSGLPASSSSPISTWTLFRSGSTTPLPVRQGFFEAEDETDAVGRCARGADGYLARLSNSWSLARVTCAGASTTGEGCDSAFPSTSGDFASSSIGLRLERGTGRLARARHRSRERRGGPRQSRSSAMNWCSFCAANSPRWVRTVSAAPGAGVQVLGVIDARGRTFDHLFVLGLNRGVFPRTVREDPVLSDALRRLLERGGHGVLPDLPIKRRGLRRGEISVRSPSLLKSAGDASSWLELDDSDRAMPPSPLIERLRWDPSGSTCRLAVAADGRSSPDRRPERSRGPIAATRIDRLPMKDQAILAGLHGRDAQLPRTLAIALEATRAGSVEG